MKWGKPGLIIGNTKSATRNDDQQQVLLAALFGVLVTLLAAASVVVAYLQLRRHRLADARRVAGVEENVDDVSLAEIQGDGDCSIHELASNIEHQDHHGVPRAPLPAADR
ncbi:hypothetical protein BST61_g1431 [Cercospora zeina]